MTTKAPNPFELAEDQIDLLVQIAREESGDNLKRFELDDRMLTLFEDIAGFETLPAARRRRLLLLLRLRYQAACQRK